MDDIEWTRNPVLSQKFVENLGKSNMDPFATRINKQLNSYLFWHPEPETVANNTLSLTWNNNRFYMFSPFSFYVGY